MAIRVTEIGIVRVVGTTSEFWITASVVGDNGNATLTFKVDGVVVETVPIFVRDNSGVWSIRKTLTTREKTVCVNDFCVTNPIFYEYPDGDTTQPPVPITGGTGGTKMWTINSRLGMKGTVTVVPGQYLKWDITAPVKASFTFGASDDIPLIGDWNGDGVEGIGAYDPKAGVFFLKNTAGAGVADYAFQYGAKGAKPASWYDTDAKKDGMAVFQGGKWYLDKNLTSGAGEITASSDEMKCAGAGIVSQCLYAKATSMGAIGAGLALAAGAVYVLFKKKKG